MNFATVLSNVTPLRKVYSVHVIMILDEDGVSCNGMFQYSQTTIIYKCHGITIYLLCYK